MSLDTLLKTGKYPNIILLYGEETFLIEEAVDKLLEKTLKNDPSKTDMDFLNANDISMDRLVATCNAYPFLAEKRVVVVNNFEKMFSGRISKKVEQTSPFTKYLDNPQDTTILILQAIVDRKKAKQIKEGKSYPYNRLKKDFEIIEFSKVYENHLPQWIENRAKYFGKTIERKAIELLITHINPNLRDINNEIEKLNIYLKEKTEITAEDVEFVVGTNREYNVFELQKAVGKRNLHQAIKILENILSTDRKEMFILVTLTNYFITLWKLIEESSKTTNKYQLCGKLRINPMFIDDYLNTLRLYSPYEINRAFHSILEADFTLKSSSVNSLYVLEKMLVRIIERKK